MCAAAFVINAIIFCFGIYSDTDLTALGAGLSMLNAPILVYVLGDSYRPSEKK
jgi:hypothetical protein